jgi:hypothetical protein
MMANDKWVYPTRFVSPDPPPEGFTLVVEYYQFMGIEKRWKYVLEGVN